METKLINKKTITIFTILIYLLSVCVFELGYCNSTFLATKVDYNFSPIRIIFYVISFIIIFLLKNKFIDESIETNTSKVKRILIYISIFVTTIVFLVYLYVLYKNILIARGMSIAMLAILFTCLFIVYASNNVSKNTLILILTFGFVFSISTDFNHAIDEKKHFMSAFNLANFNFDYAKEPITDVKLNEIPHFTKFTLIDDLLKEKYTPELTYNVEMEDVPSTPATYPFIAYVAPAIGIFLAKTFGGSIADLYIFGRIFNLLLYAILCFIALKILPFKKNILATIMAFPYLILLSASFSIDGFCMGVVAIFIAYCFKIYKEKETVTLKNVGILLGLFILMLTAKSMSYIFVAAIALILPIMKTLKKNKKYIPIIAIITVIVAIGILVLGIYIKNTQVTTDTRIKDTDAEQQLHLILHDPAGDFTVATNQVKTTLLNHTWYDMLHPDIFFKQDGKYLLFILELFLLYVAITEDDYNFKFKDKIIMVISFLLVYAMTSAVLYISCTPVGADTVNGYQTRYILPILPLLLFGLSTKKLKKDKSKNRNMLIQLTMSLFLVCSVLQTYIEIL